MAESVESFVRQLKQEGVEAGKAEGDKVVAQAKARSESMLAEAKAKAEQIIAEAQAEAARLAQRGRNELDLAARDALRRLRETVVEALAGVLRLAAADALTREDFLVTCMHDVIVQYAHKDAEGLWPIEIQVNADMLDKVTAWAVREMTDEAKRLKGRVQLHDRLRTAGFEYKVAGGTIEVTAESVAAVLGGLVSPRLRDVIDRAAEKAK